MKYKLALLIVIISSFLATNAFADLQRGLANYQAIISGKKKVEDLSQEELQEILVIHKRLQGGNTSSKYDGRTQYEIEVAHNDEIFIINGEKYEAKTYCLGWDVGDYVIFLEGSEYGACATAKLLNTTRDQTCEVWCE